MKSILTKIYYGQINVCDKKTNITYSSKENELYKTLQKELTNEDFNLLQEFLTLYSDRNSTYQEFAFSEGVKFGFKLAKELN